MRLTRPVSDLADIEAIAQQVGEVTSGEGDAADGVTRFF
jgi:hypothetical protein